MSPRAAPKPKAPRRASTAPAKRIAFARAIEASVDGEAPEAGRLWRAGWNATDKGDLNLTPESMRLIIADQASRGNPLVWYYEHEDTVPLAQRGGTPMKGVCSAPSSVIEARGPANAPECWAAQIAWTDEARRQITSGERRQLSPIAAYDEETREIVAIRNVSLCAEGATHHGTLLASKGEGTEKMDLDALIQAICEAAAAMDWAKVESLAEQAESMDGGGGTAAMARALAKAGKGAEAAPPTPPPAPAAPVKKMAAMSRPAAPAGINVEAFNRYLDANDARTEAAERTAATAIHEARVGRVEGLIAANRDLFIDNPATERFHMRKADPEITRQYIDDQRAKGKIGILAASKPAPTGPSAPTGTEARHADPKNGAVVETFGLSEIEMGQASASGVTFKAFAEARDRQAAKPRRGGQPAVGQA